MSEMSRRLPSIEGDIVEKEFNAFLWDAKVRFCTFSLRSLITREAEEDRILYEDVAEVTASYRGQSGARVTVITSNPRKYNVFANPIILRVNFLIFSKRNRMAIVAEMMRRMPNARFDEKVKQLGQVRNPWL